MSEKPRSTSFQLPDGIKDVNDLIAKYQALKEKNKERKSELQKIKEDLSFSKGNLIALKEDKVLLEEKNQYLIKENYKQLGLNKDTLQRLDSMEKEYEKVSKEKIILSNLNFDLNEEIKKMKDCNEKLKSVKSEFGDNEEPPFSGANLRGNNIEEAYSITSSTKARKHGKIDSNEFNGLVEIFITKGPNEFLKRIKWIFKKNNFSLEDSEHCELMVEYMLHQIFTPMDERRDLCLNYGLIISQFLSEKSGNIKWVDFENLIINNDDKTARKNLIMNQLKVHSANNKINEEGNGLQAFISLFEGSVLYTDSLSAEERFSLFILPFPKSVIMMLSSEKIKLQRDEKFETTPISSWYEEARIAFKASKVAYDSMKEQERIRLEINTHKNDKKLVKSNFKQNNNNVNNVNNPTETAPVEKKNENKENNNSTTETTKAKGEGSNVSFNCFKCETVEINSVSKESENSNFSLKLGIDNQWYHALLDTGANVSLVHPKLIPKGTNLIDCNINIKSTLFKNPINISKAAELKVRVETENGMGEFTLKFLIVKMDLDIVLGFNFINGGDLANQNNIRIFSKHFKDSINNKLIYKLTIPLYDKEKQNSIKKARLSKGNIELFKIPLQQRLKLNSLTWIPNIIVNNSNDNNVNKSNNNSSNNNKSNINSSKNNNNSISSGNEEDIIKERIQSIIDKFKDILVDEVADDFKPSIRDNYDMEIKVKEGSEPIKRNYGRRSEEEFKKLKEEVEKLLKKGIIEESNSDYAAVPFFVTDPSGKDRFVIDYRAVNNQTIELAVPMSNTSEIIDRTKKSKYYSIIDAKRGFHLLNLKPESRKFTAFRVGSKLYQFTRAAFGLKNSPAYFNRWIQGLIEEFSDYCQAYVDDIIIFSDTLEEHYQHINNVLEKLRDNQVFLTKDKANFFQSEVIFLGHIVSQDGIRVKDSKVEAIIRIDYPKTIKEVRSLLGAINFYRKFIPNYSDLTFSLTELTKSKDKIVITKDIERDIDKLKEMLAKSPILTKPDHDKTFIVYIDASDVGTGCVITQFDDSGLENTILYDSKKFTKEQQFYSTTDREFLALLHVLDKYRYLLVDKKFIVYTDHLNLTYYKNMIDPPKRIIRSLDKLSEFNFEIRHIRGEDNVVADFLSRSPQFYLEWDEDFTKEIKQSYSKAKDHLKSWLDTIRKRDDVIEINELLYLIDPKTDCKRLIITDKNQITMVLEEAHSTSYSGHIANYKLGEKLRKSFYFPKFWERINKFVSQCHDCQKNRILREKHGQLKSLPIPAQPWDDIAMDFMNLPKTDSGFDSVLVVIDRLSKMVRIVPTRRDIDAATAARLFWDNVVCQFGLPLSIVSDQDKLFMSDLWKELMNAQGVKMKTTVPHRPQADGQTERTNRTIKEQLQKLTEGRKNWDEAIKSIEFAINCAPSASTKVSPSCVVYGFEPRMPLNIHTHYNINFSEATTHFTHVAQDNMVDAQVEQAIQYNKDREDIEYEEGDLVLVKRSKLNTFKVDINEELKLLPNYCGPFKVVKKLSNLNYQIRLVNRKNGTRNIHVDDIKPYIEEDRILFSKRNQDQYSQLKDEIQLIIAKRCRKYGTGSRIEYKVRYKFSNEDHDEWVPLHYLENCSDLVKSFEETLVKAGIPLENNFKKKNQSII
ncbi:hypothetical protein ACTFIZ_009422 [Dictyostelium cf. discoideum]